MTYFLKPEDNPLQATTIIRADKSHITIREDDICLNQCENKPCTYYCPTRVFSWEDNKIHVNYERCVECGACPWGCPYENINWSFPPGGSGVAYGQ